MVMGGQNLGGPGWGEMLEKVTGLPSPDKVMAELQRLNRNIEALAPSLQKIASSIDGLSASDIKTLTSTLQSVKLNDLITLLDRFYARIWGR